MENEDNVLVCLRIIIELHKQFRPPHSGEITHFLHFVQSIYKELPNRLSKVSKNGSVREGHSMLFTCI